MGLDVFVTDRSGGVSRGPYESLNLALHVGDDPNDVRENRARLTRAIGVDQGDLIFVEQVHGDRVVEARRTLTPERADALVSADADLALAIMVADCVPIVLADARSTRFSVVHAGWRGLAGSVLAHTVECFDEPSQLHAMIGPSISAQQYQVGPEVAEKFRDLPDVVHAQNADRSVLDLRLAAALQLIGLGLAEENVAICKESTDDGATFFSDRAQRPCGRFALVATRALT
jgi:YfiH family protein